MLLFAATSASAQLAIPSLPTRRVNDYAQALSAADRDRLEQRLIAREQGTSNQIVVAILPSLRGENLEDYSVRLAQAWRVGQKALDNGVVFLVFLEDRKMRIEVGYGLEATLTDAIASSIIRDVVAPRFREGRLGQGIEAGLDAIAAAIAGTYQRPSVKTTGGRWFPGPTIFVVLVAIMLAIVILPLMLGLTTPYRSRRRGWTAGPSGWYAGSVGRSGWSSGRGGSFGGSGGGFSGGGGSFGGGGASGSW